MLSFTFFSLTFILCTYKSTIVTVDKHHTIQKKAYLTRKSTPIVALLSSSGNHCSSENRKSKLLFPTDELPMSRSFTLMGEDGVSVGGMAVEEKAGFSNG